LRATSNNRIVFSELLVWVVLPKKREILFRANVVLAYSFEIEPHQLGIAVQDDVCTSELGHSSRTLSSVNVNVIASQLPLRIKNPAQEASLRQPSIKMEMSLVNFIALTACNFSSTAKLQRVLTLGDYTRELVILALVPAE
jgi:hypothetical protein